MKNNHLGLSLTVVSTLRESVFFVFQKKGALNLFRTLVEISQIAIFIAQIEMLIITYNQRIVIITGEETGIFTIT